MEMDDLIDVGWRIGDPPMRCYWNLNEKANPEMNDNDDDDEGYEW